MTKIILISITLFISTLVMAQDSSVDHRKVLEAFDNMIIHLEENYVYYQDKDVDLDCLKAQYRNKIQELDTDKEVLLFFEYFIDEFYDDHFHLNTNIASSYRLYSPIYVSTIGEKTIIENIWSDQIASAMPMGIIGSEVIKFNGVAFNSLITDFPTICQDKSKDEIRTWVANKVLSGRYDEPRIITLKMKSQEEIEIDIDQIIIREDKGNLSYQVVDDVGVIRINNSLGNNCTKRKFRSAMKALKNTKGIILDLRNTIDGGNTYVANPMAGHFVSKKTHFQKYKNKQEVFYDFVKPRKPYYNKPLVILVGRWTGSMGEGLANGLAGIGRATIVGTSMRGLAGATHSNSLKHLGYGYQYSYIDVQSLDGVTRNELQPDIKVDTNNSKVDKVLQKGLIAIQKTRD